MNTFAPTDPEWKAEVKEHDVDDTEKNECICEIFEIFALSIRLHFLHTPPNGPPILRKPPFFALSPALCFREETGFGPVFDGLAVQVPPRHRPAAQRNTRVVVRKRFGEDAKDARDGVGVKFGAMFQSLETGVLQGPFITIAERGFLILAQSIAQQHVRLGDLAAAVHCLNEEVAILRFDARRCSSDARR